MARVSPNQKQEKRRRPMDEVNVIALRGAEVLLVAVRTDRALTTGESSRLSKMREGLSGQSKIVEWRWDERAREPEERVIA